MKNKMFYTKTRKQHVLDGLHQMSDWDDKVTHTQDVVLGNLCDSIESVKLATSPGEGISFALAVLLSNSIALQLNSMQAFCICSTYDNAVIMCELVNRLGARAFISRNGGKTNKIYFVHLSRKNFMWIKKFRL